MKVVVGAGPAGLYTAIKLRKAGVRDVVICDLRAGVYTRPGHLNSSAFIVAAEGTGAEIDPALMVNTRTGHIKDLERALYAEVERLRIPILQKRFVKFETVVSKPGVVVVDKDGIEQFIPADYVFDCTGAKRQVIHTVNELFPADPPFKLVPITEVPVSSHFIAYIKVPVSEVHRLPTASGLYTDLPSSLSSSPLTYARNIVKLRNLGWNELKFPRAYHALFGEKAGQYKVCLYLHAPDGLRPENYDLWVKTVLECYSPLPVYYERLPDTKPRFLSFRVKAESLDKISFVKKGLPIIVPLGDSQTDLDYYLAHGIKDGMHRINAFFEHIDVIDGKICYFDSDEYSGAVQSLIRRHKEEVMTEATKIRGLFSRELPFANLAFERALEDATIPERVIFNSILQEIRARECYLKAQAEFTACHNTTNELLFTPSTIDEQLEKLRHIHINLLKAHTDLPASCPKERQATLSLLTHLAGSYKTIGNALSVSGRHAEAGEVYKKALAIYHLPGLAGLHAKNELLLYSNLAIMHIKERQYTEVIATAKTALEVYPRCLPEEIPTGIYEKIVFNLLKASCAKIQELLASSNQAEAVLLYLDASRLMSTYATAMTEPVRLQIIELMREVAPRVTASSPPPAAVVELPTASPTTLGTAAVRSSDIAAVGSTVVLAVGASHATDLTTSADVIGAAETGVPAVAERTDAAKLSNMGLFSKAAVSAPAIGPTVPAAAQVSFSCCGWFF